MHTGDLRGFGSGKEDVDYLRGGECGVAVSSTWNPARRRRALQHRQRVDTRFINYWLVYASSVPLSSVSRLYTDSYRTVCGYLVIDRTLCGCIFGQESLDTFVFSQALRHEPVEFPADDIRRLAYQICKLLEDHASAIHI